MGRLFRLLMAGGFLFLLFSLVWVGGYRVLNPPITYLMLRDMVKGESVQREWVPLAAVAPVVPRSVIAAEDGKFCAHSGFDFDAMATARKANLAGQPLRGGSTISQQTAKNAFLWPGRTFLRKGLEAWFTFLIEQLWGKQRIMEVYLNIVEFGDGVYGVEAAARHYFNRSANRLTPVEAARLAAILPQPEKRDAARPGPYTRRYAARILKRARVVSRDGLSACLKK